MELLGKGSKRKKITPNQQITVGYGVWCHAETAGLQGGGVGSVPGGPEKLGVGSSWFLPSYAQNNIFLEESREQLSPWRCLEQKGRSQGHHPPPSHRIHKARRVNSCVPPAPDRRKEKTQTIQVPVAEKIHRRQKARRQGRPERSLYWKNLKWT